MDIYIYRCNLLSLLMLLDMGGRLGQTTRKQNDLIAVGGVYSLHSYIRNQFFENSESSLRLRKQKDCMVRSGS